MNPFFLFGVVAAALLIWSLSAFFFWRISRDRKARRAAAGMSPALRLADQWLGEAQGRMEDLARRSEQPLGAAQNELLELRLEAGRLPLGVKNLKLVREALSGSFRPPVPRKGLAETAALYLDAEDYRAEGPSLVFLKSPMGEMPCLEVEGEGALTDGQMKAALGRLGRGAAAGPFSGGFLYFPDDGRYGACLRNDDWREGLRERRLMVVDPRGLAALLMSLRLSKDADKVLRVFEQGVRSAQPLTGQSDRMGEALTRLSAHTLKLRTVMDGNAPAAPAETGEKA